MLLSAFRVSTVERKSSNVAPPFTARLCQPVCTREATTGKNCLLLLRKELEIDAR